MFACVHFRLDLCDCACACVIFVCACVVSLYACTNVLVNVCVSVSVCTCDTRQCIKSAAPWMGGIGHIIMMVGECEWVCTALTGPV